MVFAFNKPYAQVTIDTTGGTTGGAITSTPISNSVSTTGALLRPKVAQAAGLGGTSNAVTGASTSQGGSGNATVTSNYGATKIPVTTAIAPSNFPTAPCMGSTSIAGSAVLFGFSTGSSWEATECMTFEAARSFDQAGMHEDALAIKCTSKYSSAAPSCIKLRQQEAQRGQSDVQASREPTEPLNANLKKLSIPKPLTQ